MALHKKTLEMANLYYNNGLNTREIAEIYGVDKSTVNRAIHSVDRRDCPIAKDCTKCKMKECIIKDQYQYMVNGNGNRMNPLNGEIEMEWCFICHKLCVPSNYIILENSSDSGKLPRKQFFHYHCYKQLTKPNKKGTK